jgi:hypothetical protein
MAYYDLFIASWNSTTQPPAGVTGSPLTSGMTTQQKLDTHNAWTVPGPVGKMIIPAYEIYNVIVEAEYTALTAIQQQNVRDILGMGNVDVSSGTLARSRILSMFGAGTATRTNLTNLAKKYDTPNIPWWQANNYPRAFDMGDCQAAGVS